VRIGLLVLLVSGACARGENDVVPRGSGAIAGVVRLAGRPPEPTIVENTTDPHVCGERQRLDDIVVSETGGLANAIVAVDGAFVEEGSSPAPTKLVLDNRSCRFEPHASVLTTGSTIEATNSDDVLHTTHLYGPTETNFSLPAKGASQSRTLDRAGIYAVKCDLHGWMQAFVRVDDHPFHAVTDGEGRFRIEGVPPGAYRLDAWHERFGTREIQVEVERNETVDVTIEYRLEENR
jgi:plastocyanin